MQPEYVDFHCHLDLYPNFEAAIKQCDRTRTATLAVTTTPKAFSRNKRLADKSKFVRAALGLHPQLVATRSNELMLFSQLLDQTRYVGEIGLDASKQHYGSFNIQKEIFKEILLLCAQAGGKILSIHSVRSSTHVLKALADYFPKDRGTAVLHWFTGSKKEVERAVELGCYFSVNQAMLATPTGKRAVSSIPLNRLLTETDGPFVMDGMDVVRPGHVQPALMTLAELLNLQEDDLRFKVIQNLKTMLTHPMVG
ncbi:Qat anti-phage system TatD family nuclease QatD [Thalassospira sp. A3_1]|uniref:Qat anti-phage system TatD family nuclease QatD n=1 Tax=Thalassospira sp. A3_1 TaxID=2821088 RepID=UPI001AD9DF06|nr:Qat anti-phage system TatD family nuclease QatD [Thalassospira sp. A3_1]MBO9508790.1 TatD family hydrolase [Thalassospira sp. A3_1]